MANSWNGPQLGSPIRTDVPELQKKIIALLKQDPTSVADIPSGAKRLVNTSGTQWQVQQYNGSSWAAIGKLMHDVDKLDGYHAAITPNANTVAVRNANKQLEGDITGNAATASSATTLSETLPVNKGGTGATTSAAARTNLGVPPTSHASSSTTYGLGTDTNYGHVRSDGDTTKIVAGEVVVKDVAISGDVADLASNRGLLSVPFNSTRTTILDLRSTYNFSFTGSNWNAVTDAPFKDNFGATVIAKFSEKSSAKRGFILVIGHSVRKMYIANVMEEKEPVFQEIILSNNFATSSTPGIVKPGTGMTVDAAGALNVTLNNTVTSTSTTQAATANAVKTAYDKAEEAASKGGLPLGHIFAWPFPTAPDGCIILNGSTYNRTLYADFFAYIKAKGWTKTETEWQSIAQANNGFCPWYSEGDGSTNFRTPKFAPYQKIALVSGDAGKYYEAGLPNITGDYTKTESYRGYNDGTFSGAFVAKSLVSRTNLAGGSSKNSEISGWSFDASLSNPIYGNSTAVTPESNDWVICAVAFGTATNVGSVDVANVMSAVGQVQAEVSTKLEDSTVHITKTWKSTDGTSWYRKYSDGWIEQGGPMSTNKNVTFHVAFSNTNYYIDVTWNGGKSSNFWPADWRITKSSNAYFTTTATTDAENVHGLCWYACGY